jgi:hypothetical protein
MTEDQQKVYEFNLSLPSTASSKHWNSWIYKRCNMQHLAMPWQSIVTYSTLFLKSRAHAWTSTSIHTVLDFLTQANKPFFGVALFGFPHRVMDFIFPDFTIAPILP